MSYVTNVLVLTRHTPGELRPIMEAGYQDVSGRRVQFADIAAYHGRVHSPSEHWAGGKLPEADVWALAANYLDFDALLAWLRTVWLPSTCMPDVRVAVCFESSDAWEWHSL